MGIRRQDAWGELLAFERPTEEASRSYVPLDQIGTLGPVVWAADGAGLIVEVHPAADEPSVGAGSLVYVPLDGAPVSLGISGSPLVVLPD